MAQPSGQILLDTGSPYYGNFWYANADGLWDARNGVMATKTGTGSVTATGDAGQNVVNADGATWFQSPAPLRVGPSTTMIFKIKKNSASDNHGMLLGSITSTSKYWWRSGNTIRNAAVTFTLAGTTAWETLAIVQQADGTAKIYTDGVYRGVTAYSGAENTADYQYILSAYTGTSYQFIGAIEYFLHIPNFVASDADIASLYADPYQVLASSGITQSIAITLEGVTASISQSVTGVIGQSLSITLDDVTASISQSVSGDSITISTPSAYKMFQRDGAGVASIPITGVYSGSPASIEARFNGGSWSTIVATPTGGTFSGTLAGCATGQGLLEVRFSNSTGITGSKALVGVGDIYMVAGQSNNVGMATNVVAPSPSAFTAIEYDRSGVWRALTESATVGAGFDSNSGQASYFGQLSNLLQAQGVPVAFVPCASGSTAIAVWQKGGALYNNTLARSVAVGGHKALLWWQGESDTATLPATYEAGVNQMINDWYADTGKGVFVVKICNWNNSNGAAAIRSAQSNVIASNAHVVGSADANVWTGGNVHYTTTTEVNNVAAAIYSGMVAAFYNKHCTLTLTTNGSTPAANQAGIVWAWYDAAPPNLAALPVANGTGATTNVGGVFDVALPGTTLTSGQVGTLLALISDGTPGSSANKAFCAPVAVI